MKNFTKINRAFMAKRKHFALLCAFLCASMMGWADYVDYISLSDFSTYSQDFNTIGGEDVDPATQTKTAYVRATTLPDGWKVDSTTTVRTNSTYTHAKNSTSYIGGQSLASDARNGLWNFGATGSSDRAIGGITTNVAGGARTINVMAHLHNDAGLDINSLALSYDIEKYRYGALAAGFTVQLYTSADGEAWTSAGSDFCSTYAKDESTVGAEVVPIDTRAVSGAFNVAFPDNGDLYLLWSISSTSGADAKEAQAFGIDNVSITPSASPILPTYAIFVTDNGTITENFDCLGGSDVDPSGSEKTAFDRGSTLPIGWKIERNLNTSNPRKMGSYGEAADTTMWIGGQGLSSDAKNGTWNFGMTGSTDRAVGGLTTNATDGTRGLTVMVRLFNSSRADIESLTIAYDIEKYRNSNNSTNFRVQLFTSSDGTNWISAGEDFETLYSTNGNVNPLNPASTTHVSNTLPVSFVADGDLYLAWNIAVSSGTSCNAAPALAIDNVSIRPAANARTTADGWASFASAQNLNIPDGVTAYQADYTIDGTTETLVLTALTNGVIPANTGVLLQGANNSVIRNFAIADDAAAIAAAETEVSGNDLEASVERTVLAEDYDYLCIRYSTEIGTFFQLYQGAYIPAGKAYLKLAKSGGSSVPGRQMRIVVKPHAPTAIENVNDEQTNTEWTKVVRDGQLLIIRGEQIYTIYGACVR